MIPYILERMTTLGARYLTGSSERRLASSYSTSTIGRRGISAVGVDPPTSNGGGGEEKRECTVVR